MVINQSQPSVVLLFAGQGNPVMGMGAELCDLNAMTKHIWDCASDITGMDLRRVCQKGPMNRLVQTTAQQVAVTAINITLYSLCAEYTENSRIVGACGHSVGEYSALFASGAINLENLFGVIHVRAKIMNDLSKIHRGSMLAVKGIDFSTMQRLIHCRGIPVEISCNNSQDQQVVGGTLSDISEFYRFLIESGLDAVKLGVSGAWHTHFMEEGVQMMRDFLRGIHITQPKFNVLMNVSGEAEHDPWRIKENLSLHLVKTVQWEKSMTTLLNCSPPVQFLEISNKPYLGQMLNDFASFTPDMAVHCRTLIEHYDSGIFNIYSLSR